MKIVLFLSSIVLVLCANANEIPLPPQVSPPQEITVTTFKIPIKWHEATVRIKVNGRICGSGVAVHKRFIATAYHVVDGNPEKIDRIDVEIHSIAHRATIDIHAVLVEKNEMNDSAILMTDDEIPNWVDMVENPTVNVLDTTVMFGAAAGGPIVTSVGFFSSFTSEDVGNWLWLCSNSCYFGCSGGPIFDANTGQLIGLVHAVYVGRYGLAPNATIFIPITYSYKLLQKAIKRLEIKQEVKKQPEEKKSKTSKTGNVVYYEFLQPRTYRSRAG